MSDRRSSGNVRVRRNGVRSYSPVSAIRLIFTTATPTNSAVHVLSGARRPTSRRAVSHFPGKNERSTISQALYPLQNLAKRRGYFDISTIQRGYNALKRWRGPEKNGAITNGRGDAGAPFPPHRIRPFHTTTHATRWARAHHYYSCACQPRVACVVFARLRPIILPTGPEMPRSERLSRELAASFAPALRCPSTSRREETE